MALTDLFELLHQHRNDSNALLMEKYMRSQFKFLGIKAPERRRLTQPYLKQELQRAKKSGTDYSIDWMFIKNCWQAPEREFQLLAADYLKLCQIYLKADDLNKLKELVTTKSWWDSVDSLVKIVGFLAHQSADMKAQLLDWSLSDNIWLRRASIIHQLGMKNHTDTSLLSRCIQNNFASQEFFINKAIGWALRDYAKTNEQWVSDFLTTHQQQLAPLSWREASKHLNK